MKVEYTALYQSEKALKRCLPEGVGAISALIDTLRETLTQPEFQSAPPEDRAIVIAIHSSGAIRGWACARSGVALEREQAFLEAALTSTEVPSVSSGVFLVALVYATDSAPLPPKSEVWVPIPSAWQLAAEVSSDPLEVEALVARFFEPGAAV